MTNVNETKARSPRDHTHARPMRIADSDTEGSNHPIIVHDSIHFAGMIHALFERQIGEGDFSQVTSLMVV